MLLFILVVLLAMSRTFYNETFDHMTHNINEPYGYYSINILTFVGTLNSDTTPQSINILIVALMVSSSDKGKSSNEYSNK